MTKEDAICYRDWCSKVEEALERGHDAVKVKEAIFASLKGMARDNTKIIDENSNLHVIFTLGVHDVPVTQCCIVWLAAEAF